MKKNIVIVVSAMNMGGAQRVASILCNQWSKNGHAVTLIVTFSGESINHYQLNDNVVLKYLNNNPLLPKNKLFNLVWKLIYLRRIIKSQNPDLVISFLARVNVASSLAMIGIKSPLIICERTWPPFASLNNKLLWLYRILFRGVDTIIVQTEKSKAWLTNNFPHNNVNIIPNPAVYPVPLSNERLISPNSIISQNKNVILASGRLHKFKQFDLLIRAFMQLKDKHPDWYLVILGDGEESDNLNSITVELGLTDRVFFPGSVGNISEWYERADLFVLSSIVEGFPNVLLEAMTYGLPCISFDCDTGPRDMIQNGVNGILVNPSDKESGLTYAMNQIISNQEFRKKIAYNSVLLREKYSVSNVIKKWNKILDA
jgi:GalNAc-alpha-(1->4)-GalNAc-alpha-(1->3)-diNAcBac-PP-undecaprenol alpha-1,4-N-acetyl-D-galactosaminyltransferase